MKRIALDLPYPSLDGITKDLNTARLIIPSYTGLHSELTAILQYFYHSLYFGKEKLNDIAEVLIGIAIAEMEHLEILGKLLLRLGYDPVFAVGNQFNYNFYSSASVTYSKTPQKMLLDDVSSEMFAINEYSKILGCLSNEKVGAVIQRIRLDEELHVAVLKEKLDFIMKADK